MNPVCYAQENIGSGFKPLLKILTKTKLKNVRCLDFTDGTR